MTVRKISVFFDALGFRLKNTRWSWGAGSQQAPFAILLRTWDHDQHNGYVRVLRSINDTANPGRSERIEHLRALWAGGLPGYTVIATAVDANAHPRQIKSYEENEVRALQKLVARPDGSIWALLGKSVPIEQLSAHRRRHRLMPADGPFPETGAGRIIQAPSGKSLPAYLVKLPEVRAWLIDLALAGNKATYAEARAPFGFKTFEHRHAMDRLGHECLENGEPILTSLIVDAETGRCSDGFFKEFGIEDDAQERQECYAYPWRIRSLDRGRDGSSNEPQNGADAENPLTQRARQFAQVRPYQARFRNRLFVAHGGACCVTGCTIVAALDAAHRHGRSWEKGHNQASDGWLLRKDIHALYDAGLLRIDEDGSVRADDPRVATHYAAFVGRA